MRNEKSPFPESEIIRATLPEKKGLSERSLQLIEDTSKIISNILPSKESLKDKDEAGFLKINKNVLRPCTISILRDLGSQERQNLFEKPISIKEILRSATSKIELTAEGKKEWEAMINSLSDEETKSPSAIMRRLNMMDSRSVTYEVIRKLNQSFESDLEVALANAYMNMTAR